MKSNAVRETDVVHDAPGQASVTMIKQDISLIGHVQVSLTAQIGTLSLSVDKLFGLAKGDLLELNELLEEPVTLLLDGKPVARGELLGIDDHFAIRILELS